MKNLIGIILLAVSSTGLFAQANQNLSFTDLDKHLLSLYIASVDMDRKASIAAIDEIEEEWLIVQNAINENDSEIEDIQDFLRRVDSYVLSLRPCHSKTDFSCLRSISSHILFEFRSLRQCLFITEYPLDNLWDGIDAYFVIRSTINDRMFNLKEWFEFEDDVNDFICKWEYYDLKHIKEIQSYYPGVLKSEHQMLKEKVNSCTVDLLKSIETGYQSNFVLPCDELGQALNELIRMYAKSKTKLLM